MTRPLFSPGRIVATPNALEALTQAGQSASELLDRHLQGDWGILCEEDKQSNAEALKEQGRLMSAYLLRTGEKIWVITEWDRSITTVLLPEDY